MTRGISGAKLQGAFLVEAKLQGARLKNANFDGATLSNVKLQKPWSINAEFQEAGLDFTKFHNPELSGASFRGVQSQSDIQKAIIKAVKMKSDLLTNLSGITLNDDDGNELNDEEKKAWFRKHTGRQDAVDALPKEKVQELFKDLVQEWLKEKE